MEGWGSVCHNGRGALAQPRPKEKCDPGIVPPAKAHPFALPRDLPLPRFSPPLFSANYQAKHVASFSNVPLKILP